MVKTSRQCEHIFLRLSPFLGFLGSVLALLLIIPLIVYTVYQFSLKSNSQIPLQFKISFIIYEIFLTLHITLQVIGHGPEIYYNWSNNGNYCKFNIYTQFICPAIYFAAFFALLFYRLKLRYE